MGCYPLFACQDWSQLHLDLANIGHDLVSLALVTDPFGDYKTTYLQQCFGDVVLPFKEHFIVDLALPIDTSICRHHYRYARKASRILDVERCEDPALCIDEWNSLYVQLIERHQISGLQAFSRSAFARQMIVPGLVAFRAKHRDITVGMVLWYIQGQVGYYHLGAYNALGYELRASFALFWFAIHYFVNCGLRWLDLGAGAGLKNQATDGLSRFKRGWSTGARTAYFCGRIFDPERYAVITRLKGITANSYFPAYRRGEFGQHEQSIEWEVK
jgi:hypothetical protein